MSKIDFYLLSLLFVLIIPSCKKEFDVFLNNNTKILNYNTKCGSIKLEVSQLRNESFTITAECNLHDTITFNKDSIIVEYNNSHINDVDFEKAPKWSKSMGELIKESSILLNNDDGIIIGFILRDVNFNYPDTIHVHTKGAFYCEGKSIVEIEKINIILKNE